jgi:tRNA (mo5U34)-methyltransferase
VDYSSLFNRLRNAGFNQWIDRLERQQKDWLCHHGDYARWSDALSRLPPIDDLRVYLDRPAVTIDGVCENHDSLFQALKSLMPWRKGPYRFADILIDSEWRSDFKWERLKAHLSPLENRRVLDIGCGNGYHCWRMLSASPQLVIGIEPSVLFNLQFQAVQKYLNRPEICLLPIGVEQMPAEMDWFDTVFSMGILYHRRSPIDHLLQLKALLVSGGELCLETLVIEGGHGDILLPKDRYARMKNVWFIPSAPELANWLDRCGFTNVRIADISATTLDEQRVTEWMQFESLSESLDTQNTDWTVEGLPAPKRAILFANKD